MLATSVRVRPWSERWSLLSEGRTTWIRPSSTAMSMSAGSARWSVPFGPLIWTAPLFRVTSTPFGSGMGSLPIRDIGCLPLPNGAEHFAAEVLAARLAVRQEALGRADDRHAHAVQDTRQLV